MAPIFEAIFALFFLHCISLIHASPVETLALDQKSPSTTSYCDPEQHELRLREEPFPSDFIGVGLDGVSYFCPDSATYSFERMRHACCSFSGTACTPSTQCRPSTQSLFYTCASTETCVTMNVRIGETIDHWYIDCIPTKSLPDSTKTNWYVWRTAMQTDSDAEDAASSTTAGEDSSETGTNTVEDPDAGGETTPPATGGKGNDEEDETPIGTDDPSTPTPTPTGDPEGADAGDGDDEDGGGISLENRIALGVGIGIGIPTLLATIYYSRKQLKAKTESHTSDRYEMRPY